MLVRVNVKKKNIPIRWDVKCYNCSEGG